MSSSVSQYGEQNRGENRAYFQKALQQEKGGRTMCFSFKCTENMREVTIFHQNSWRKLLVQFTCNSSWAHQEKWRNLKAKRRAEFMLEILELLWQPLHRNSAWEKGNKVEFTIKLSLLTLLPILLTAVMVVIIALLTLFYPQRALRPWKIIPCAKPQTHLWQMGFHEGWGGDLFFPWRGQAVTVLQRLQKKSWFVLRRDRTRRLSVLAHLYNSWVCFSQAFGQDFCPL